MVSVFYPLTPVQDDQGHTTLKDVEFRFTIRTVTEMERATGCGVAQLVLLQKNAQAMVALLCYGLRWKDRSFTEDKAIDLAQKFIEAGGDVEDLTKHLVKALNESGVYGKVSQPAKSEGELNPTTKTSATSETPTAA